MKMRAKKIKERRERERERERTRKERRERDLSKLIRERMYRRCCIKITKRECRTLPHTERLFSSLDQN